VSAPASGRPTATAAARRSSPGPGHRWPAHGLRRRLLAPDHAVVRHVAQLQDGRQRKAASSSMPVAMPCSAGSRPGAGRSAATSCPAIPPAARNARRSRPARPARCQPGPTSRNSIRYMARYLVLRQAQAAQHGAGVQVAQHEAARRHGNRHRGQHGRQQAHQRQEAGRPDPAWRAFPDGPIPATQCARPSCCRCLMRCCSHSECRHLAPFSSARQQQAVGHARAVLDQAWWKAGRTGPASRAARNS
jgi:hypothetical protein